MGKIAALKNYFEAADYLGISHSTVRRLVREKLIEHYRIGGRVLFDDQQLDRFIQDSIVKSGGANG
jgi:excisionase family DNA binding protein